MRNFFFASFLCAAATGALAQDQQVGARTKAMGGSYTAFEDDPVSIWLNPAGIATQPDSFGIAYQTYTIYEFHSEASSPSPRYPPEYAWSEPAIVPSFLGVTVQLGDPENPHSLGVCFAAPFRLKLGYNEGAALDPAVIQFVDQLFYRIRGAYAYDIRLKPAGSEGFLTHLAVGVGLDINVTNWTYTKIEEKNIGGENVNSTISASATDMGFGGGAGVLLGVYDNARDLKVNFGAAYQSQANYDFSIDFDAVPLFDWPNQWQVGATVYLMEGLPLRFTLDAQLIQWGDASRSSILPGFDDFQDVVNYSFGAEYRINASKKITLYPRAGVRYYDAPWDSDDKDEMPAIGGTRLIIHTRDEKFVVVSAGLGIGWSSAEGKLRSFDFAFDVGGDAPSLALSYTMEF